MADGFSGRLSFGRITMVGFGLLASSIAAAIKQAKIPTVIRAVSSPSTLKRARELELADEFFEYDGFIPGCLERR